MGNDPPRLEPGKKRHLIRSACEAPPTGGAFNCRRGSDRRRPTQQPVRTCRDVAGTCWIEEFGDAFDYSGAGFPRAVCRGAGFLRTSEVIHLVGPIPSAAIAYR